MSAKNLLEGSDYNYNQYQKAGEEVRKNAIINMSYVGKTELVNLPGAFLTEFNKDFFERVSFNDREYILREDSLDKMLKEETVHALAMSIHEVGLINPIYLQEMNEGYRIVSGYRRSCAIQYGYNEYGDEFEVEGKVVIIPKEYTKEELEVLQVNENTHRKDLNILELAYRIHSYCSQEGKTLEDAAEHYNLSSSQTQRLSKALSYPKELKAILDEVGISKAEEMNKLIKLLNSEKTVVEIIEEYKDLTRDEIRAEMKRIKKGIVKKVVEFKASRNATTIKIAKGLSEENMKALEEYIRKLVEGQESK